VVPKFARWADIAIEGGAADPKLPAEIRYVCLPGSHRGLRQADLVLGEFEAAPALASAGPGGGEASHRAFFDEIGFKLSQRGEYGVTTRFVQNRTLSRKALEIRGFHKRPFAHEFGCGRISARLSFQNAIIANSVGHSG
jgi:hypothetical protein